METTLFDINGYPTAYIAYQEDNTIYLWDGMPTAYLYEDIIYGFNGYPIGWFVNGIVRDRGGLIVGFTREASPIFLHYEPYKSYKKYRPYRHYKRYAGSKPFWHNAKSSIPLREFLLQGV